ncbi:MAG: diphthamide synthesis protein [Nanoarchaeota archaeon]
MFKLELDKAVSAIKKNKAKRILLQLPDGLRPKAKEIQEHLQKHTKALILIWSGSCYGACDLPVESKNIGVDMIIHWGHAPWKYSRN